MCQICSDASEDLRDTAERHRFCTFEILFRRLSFVAWRWNLCNTASGLCEDAFKFASVGFRFIQNAFKGGKYLSAHCRRTDQLRMTRAKMI